MKFLMKKEPIFLNQSCKCCQKSYPEIMLSYKANNRHWGAIMY